MTPMHRVLAGFCVVMTAYACSVQQGNSASLAVRFKNRDASSPVLLTYARQDGNIARLLQLYVTVSAVSLTPCATATRFEIHPKTWLASWPDLLVPPAHAHSPSAAGKLGEPHVVAFVGSAESTLLGTVAPSGASCAVSVFFGPADDDAVGMPAGDKMLGQTALAELSTGAAADVQKTDFSLTRSYPLPGSASGSDMQIELVVDVPKVLAAGLEGDMAALPRARWVTAVADATTASRVR